MESPSRWSVALGAAVLVASTLLGATGSGAATSNNSPIVLGYIGDLTGVAASTFADGPAGAQARIDLQNAEGGVDGHKLKMVVADTQSSPTLAATAAENLVESDHVFGIMENSALFFGAAPYLLKAGVPVTGTAIDGPEWSTDTNLFDASGPPISGPIDGHLWVPNTAAAFFKSLGATKIAGIAANTSAAAGVDAIFDTFPTFGLTKCYSGILPLGSINVTTDVLAIKNAGCDGLYVSNVDSTAVAFGQGLKDAGLNLKAAFLGEGYDNTVLHNATNRAAVKNGYFGGTALDPNFTQPNAATTNMLTALRKYDNSFPGGIPDLGLFGGWEAADLMILGLEHAGTNPTRTSFMSNLRKVASYDVGGLLPSSWGFTHLGTDLQAIPKTTCTYFYQMQGDKFVVANHGKPYCGKYVETAVP